MREGRNAAQEPPGGTTELRKPCWVCERNHRTPSGRKNLALKGAAGLVRNWDTLRSKPLGIFECKSVVMLKHGHPEAEPGRSLQNAGQNTADITLPGSQREITKAPTLW